MLLYTQTMAIVHNYGSCTQCLGNSGLADFLQSGLNGIHLALTTWHCCPQNVNVGEGQDWFSTFSGRDPYLNCSQFKYTSSLIQVVKMPCEVQ